MANILLISYHFPPFNESGCRRIYSCAKYLKRLGHEVVVLSADTPDDEAMRNFDVDVSFLQVYRLKYFDIRRLVKKIFRVGGPTSNNFGTSSKKKLNVLFVEKILNILIAQLSSKGILFGYSRMPTFSDQWFLPAYKKAKDIIRKGNINVIITNYTPPVVNLIGVCLKRKFKNILWIADFRDLWTQNHMYKGLFIISTFEKWLERRCIKMADLIITVSHILKKALESEYRDKEIITIENGFDFELNSTFVKNGKRKIMYFGTLYRNRGDLTPLIKAVKKLKSEEKLQNTEIDFYGAYETKLILKELLKKDAPVKDVLKYKGFISYSEVLKKYQEASALLFVECDKKNDGVLTGKIFEYMCAKKPILCIGVDRGSYVGEFLNKTGLCFFCGNDVERIKYFLLKLQDGKIAVNPNREYIAQFSRKRQVDKLNEIIISRLQG